MLLKYLLGKVQSPRTVLVDDEALESGKIYINLEGRASVPEMPGIHEATLLTNP
jgi:hypothetical protein